MAALGATLNALVRQPLKKPFIPSFFIIRFIQSNTPEYSRLLTITSPVVSDTSITCDRCCNLAFITCNGYVVVLATLI